jgi:hypothetical protein
MNNYAKTIFLLPLLLLGCPSPSDGEGESTDAADEPGDGDGEPTTDGDTSTETTGDGDGDTSGDGDGDGEPGDGDGDGDACDAPTFAADSNNVRWVTFGDWPAWAQHAEPVDLQEAIDGGILTPVELGNGAECFELSGTSVHTCVIEVECVPLLGYPLSEVSLEPGDCAMIGGAWTMTGSAATLPGCWGAVDGFAVRLQEVAPTCDGEPGDVGCACVDGSCLDGLTCKSEFCSP